MAKGGTKVYCPGCRKFSVCKAISPTTIGKPKAQRWHRTDYQDIAWFRRGRECLGCGHKFLSAEVDEMFIMELVELRKRLAKKQKTIVSAIRRKVPWLKREETIPLDVAKRFIRSTAWWLTHSSGFPIRAPGHANHIYKSSRHGWAVDFGANTFLVGKVIERCKNTINDYLDEALKGHIPLKSEVIDSLERQVSGAVANVDGNEYDGYPIDNGELIFGAQSIKLSDAVNFIIQETCTSDIFLDT